VRVVAGKRAVLEALRAGRADHVLIARGARGTAAMRDVLAAAEAAGVRTEEASPTRLQELDADPRGVVAVLAEERRPTTLGERDLETMRFADDAVAVILDGITDPQNLGAGARSAEAAGVAVIVTRTRRSADVTPAAVRASAGALLHLAHARVPNLVRAMQRLQDAGFWVVGLDGAATTSIYEEPCPPGRIALVVGSESTGMSRLVRERCDQLVALPLRGRVESLNASAALAAVLFGWVVPSRA
jgi:23S rRNA (guanosine2251-2'-O)-methyltransferase